jgi:hypothetical protein
LLKEWLRTEPSADFIRRGGAWQSLRVCENNHPNQITTRGLAGNKVFFLSVF